jgi:hypothetical protein
LVAIALLEVGKRFLQVQSLTLAPLVAVLLLAALQGGRAAGESLDALELELVLCGSPSIDLGDWKRHTTYGNGLTASSPRVLHFWRVVEHGLDEDQRTRLLQFVTGTSRLPAGGFANLQGVDGSNRKFELFGLAGGNDTVPRSHTCFNRLDMPNYDFEHMKTVLTNLVAGDVGGLSID